MDDSISRKNAINKLKEHRALFCRNQIEFRGLPKDEKCRVDEIDACISVLRNLPSAERKGEWIEEHEPYTWMGYIKWHCSCCGFKCGYEQEIKNRTNCCPDCGARMLNERRKTIG